MADTTLEGGIAEVTRRIKRDLASGFFVDLDEVLDCNLAIMSSEYSGLDLELLRPHAEQALQAAIEEQMFAEATWPLVTDCDRFVAAFAQLESEGVVCRHDFSCCDHCAAGEMWEEIQRERDKGREIIGSAHYNWEDTENAVEGYGVYLSYGSVLQGERPAVEIGHRIANAMRGHGLAVTWDGSINTRIHVKLDWKRRLPPSARPAP